MDQAMLGTSFETFNTLCHMMFNTATVFIFKMGRRDVLATLGLNTRPKLFSFLVCLGLVLVIFGLVMSEHVIRRERARAQDG